MLLTHVCCSVCALKLVGDTPVLNKHNQVMYYYNPNIHPESEWHARRGALQKVTTKLGYRVIVENWCPKDYFEQIKILAENEMVENKKLRCPLCWSVRLVKTFEYAKNNGFAQVTTTMLTSEYMDKKIITAIGKKFAKDYGVEFVVPQVNKCKNCARGFYKQNYCGCVYSLKERLQEKYLI